MTWQYLNCSDSEPIPSITAVVHGEPVPVCSVESPALRGRSVFQELPYLRLKGGCRVLSTTGLGLQEFKNKQNKKNGNKFGNTTDSEHFPSFFLPMTCVILDLIMRWSDRQNKWDRKSPVLVILTIKNEIKTEIGKKKISVVLGKLQTVFLWSRQILSIAWDGLSKFSVSAPNTDFGVW